MAELETDQNVWSLVKEAIVEAFFAYFAPLKRLIKFIKEPKHLCLAFAVALPVLTSLVLFVSVEYRGLVSLSNDVVTMNGADAGGEAGLEIELFKKEPPQETFNEYLPDNKAAYAIVTHFDPLAAVASLLCGIGFLGTFFSVLLLYRKRNRASQTSVEVYPERSVVVEVNIDRSANVYGDAEGNELVSIEDESGDAKPKKK